MSRFVFESYDFDEQTYTATFWYSIDGDRRFKEVVELQRPERSEFDRGAFDEAMFLAFLVIGTSYYKTFPGKEVEFVSGAIDDGQAQFLNHVYQEGLSQYASENGLTRNDLIHFYETTRDAKRPLAYTGNGILSLQSGGKDSLLTASLLQENGIDFSSFYVASGDTYPELFAHLGSQLAVVKRLIDRTALKQAGTDGGLNGHVPVTYIVLSIALLQAILLNKNTILTSIGHEGEEPAEWIGDLPVNHQWSKTWEAEQLFSDYIVKYVSKDIKVGSALRRYSELRIAELFAEKAWANYGHSFSSCNLANYMQGADNTVLRWCGECPKCANSYLLFAPFIDADEQRELFGGQDLFEKPLLEETFKGLLGIDGAPKPFECIGEIDELRLAYAMRRDGYGSLPFAVPPSSFDYRREYPSQAWTNDLV